MARRAEADPAFGSETLPVDNSSIKIVIVGSSGSGKIWLANTLGAIAAAPVLHLDELSCIAPAARQERPARAIAAQVEQIRSTESWVVAGGFGELAAPFLEDAHALIWLNFHWAACREFSMSAASDDRTPETGFTKLVEWASAYQTRGESFAGHLSLYRRFPGPRLCLQTEEEAISLVDAAMQVGIHDALGEGAARLNSLRWR
ncbi:hypothetical protein QTI66_14720 [Variovorax sp. J22R133]|uniref:hypothetical protein n=1 Tax=Variovorax brevis TaxID=3053503 RepID=UPI002574F08A|nr:hypothetical protein [Variovorax sp. J22R133]MDM0113409.1 hypothetical protein [Variovorax sp. J22R133]